MMWLTILNNWRIILGVFVIACMGTLSMRLQVVTVQRNEARTTLETYKIQAALLRDQAKEQSDKSLEAAKNDYALSTKKAEANAWNNAKARFGVACGIGARGLPNLSASGGSSEAGIPEGTVPEDQPESVAVGQSFVEACAGDVVWINTVKGWCHNNGLKGCE